MIGIGVIEENYLLILATEEIFIRKQVDKICLCATVSTNQTDGGRVKTYC